MFWLWFIGFVFFTIMAIVYFVSTLGNALTGQSWGYRLIITVILIMLAGWTYSHL